MQGHKIGLGTVQFGLPYGISNTQGQTPAAEVKLILDTAKIKEVNLLDSAAAYGDAEMILGKNDLTSFNVVSKYIKDSTSDTIEQLLSQSLQRLQLKKLYGYLAHRPLDILKNPDQWKQLKDLQQRGIIEKIGFSLNTTEELQSLLDRGFIPGLIQVPINYFDNRFEKIAIQLKAHGCEIHARSAFLQGLFFKEVKTLPAFFDIVKPLIEKTQRQVTNLPGALLKYVIKKNFVDKVIVGVENAKQLVNNIDELSLAGELEQSDSYIPEQILMPSAWPKS